MTRLDSRQALQNKGRMPYMEVYLYIRPLVYLSIFNVESEPKNL